jgi:prolyl 4-hydroxylase
MLCKFLSDKECDHLIALARPHLIPSKVVDEQNTGEAIDARRSSHGFFIHNNWTDPIIVEIEKRINAITGLPMQNGEDLHVLRYGIGGEYQPHHDYFHGNTPGGAKCLLRGGQRLASLIMYLNTPEAGGETVFPHPRIFITPRKGDAILFYNCTPDGVPDPRSLHGGAPVLSGEKWILTKWIREKPFH